MHKLHTMVESMVWNEENNSLAAVADGHLVVWFYPEVVYMDRDLLSHTLSRQSVDWGKTAEILDFRGTRVTVRRSDGALQVGEQRLFSEAGSTGFLLWRSVYVVKQVSTRTRVLVLFDWLKTKVFGRDVTRW